MGQRYWFICASSKIEDGRSHQAVLSASEAVIVGHHREDRTGELGAITFLSPFIYCSFMVILANASFDERIIIAIPFPSHLLFR